MIEFGSRGLRRLKRRYDAQQRNYDNLPPRLRAVSHSSVDFIGTQKKMEQKAKQSRQRINDGVVGRPSTIEERYRVEDKRNHLDKMVAYPRRKTKSDRPYAPTLNKLASQNGKFVTRGGKQEWVPKSKKKALRPPSKHHTYYWRGANGELHTRVGEKPPRVEGPYEKEFHKQRYQGVNPEKAAREAKLSGEEALRRALKDDSKANLEQWKEQLASMRGKPKAATINPHALAIRKPRKPGGARRAGLVAAALLALTGGGLLYKKRHEKKEQEQKAA
jgi:hypothetical protein